jgi:hypothetical protein
MRNNTSILLAAILCFGCTNKTSKINISVSFADSNHSVKISGFDRAIIGDIGRDTTIGVWQSLLPVYKMPADTDLKDYQDAQPGSYKVRDSVVVFTPDTPFKKSQAYFLRYYQYDKVTDAWDYIKYKKRPGALSYTDLIFKY